MNPLGLLLEFVNTKDWDIELLRNFQMRLIGATQKLKEEKYDLVRDKKDIRRAFLDVFEIDSTQVSFRSPKKYGDLLIFDFDGPTPKTDTKVLSEEECLAHLTALQNKWRNTLEETAKQGPDNIYLNSIIEREKFYLNITEDPFSPNISPHNAEIPFDGRIEGIFAMVFVLKKGGDFRRLRICRNPACGKMFLFKRASKESCSDKCRLAFHNKIYTQTGRNAARMKKLRGQGKCQ